jgi:PDDEXK-like domain of unknown function (DUF3799)
MTTIRTLAPGEKITANGFYSIPLSVHHGQPCDGVSVTSGILRTMELQTPADVFAFHVLNPNRWEKKETDALRLGVAMAAYVEGGKERVLQSFRIHPEDKPRRPTAAQIAACDQGRATEAGQISVEYWRAVDAEPDDYLTAAELETICTMGAVLAADPAAAAVMGGVPEVTAAWFEEVTQLWVLSRPDTISFDGAASDFKKISTQGRPLTHWMLDRKIEQFGYVQQMALAAEAFEVLTGNQLTSIGLVFQTDTPPHSVVLREIAEEDIAIGKWLNRQARARFRECLDSGYWPGPGDDIGAYQMDPKLRERLLQRMQIAGVAP